MSTPVNTPTKPQKTEPPAAAEVGRFRNLTPQLLKQKIQELRAFYNRDPRVIVTGPLFDYETGLEISQEVRGPIVGTWGNRLRMYVNDSIRLINFAEGDHVFHFYSPIEDSKEIPI